MDFKIACLQSISRTQRNKLNKHTKRNVCLFDQEILLARNYPEEKAYACFHYLATMRLLSVFFIKSKKKITK